MKKYVSTKQIDAEPMTVGDAYRCNLIKTDIYKNLEKDSLGFYIIDEDGYESWSPAKTFCKAYKLADTPLDRLIIEQQELRDKINKLKEIMCRKEFCDFDYKQRILLNMQLRSMIEYSFILEERIENM